MKRKNELSPEEIEHIMALGKQAGIPQILVKPLTPESSTELVEKIRSISPQLTAHERRVLESEEYLTESLRKAIRSAERKAKQSRGTTIRGRKKRRRAGSED